MNYSELQNARSLLGVDKNATKEEVKKVFRRKALDTHPDTNFNDSKEEATAKMQELNKAKEILDKTYESDFVEPIDPQEETLKRQAEAAKRHREDDERRAEQQREWEKIKNQERTRAESQQKTTYTEEEPEKVSMPSKLNFGRGLHTNLEGSFSTFARNARFYNSVYPSFQKAIPTNLVLQEYLKLINERANQDFEKLFVQALIKRAESLTKEYLQEREIADEPKYESEVKKSFILVMAILAKARTLDGLDDELQLIKDELATDLGKELWKSLSKEGDFIFRMYVVRAILSGISIQEVSEDFQISGREGLDKYSHLDIEEPSEEFEQEKAA